MDRFFKTLSSLVILLIGLNLATTGLAVGLCTGQPGCIYCASGSMPHPQDNATGHACNMSEPLPLPCDFESNDNPAVYMVDSLFSKAEFREILRIEGAAAVSGPATAESDQNRFSPRTPAALFHRTIPLHLLLVTFLR
jgi:hypothetical protein